MKRDEQQWDRLIKREPGASGGATGTLDHHQQGGACGKRTAAAAAGAEGETCGREGMPRRKRHMPVVQRQARCQGEAAADARAGGVAGETAWVTVVKREEPTAIKCEAGAETAATGPAGEEGAAAGAVERAARAAGAAFGAAKAAADRGGDSDDDDDDDDDDDEEAFAVGAGAAVAGRSFGGTTRREAITTTRNAAWLAPCSDGSESEASTARAIEVRQQTTRGAGQGSK